MHDDEDGVRAVHSEKQTTLQEIRIGGTCPCHSLAHSHSPPHYIFLGNCLYCFCVDINIAIRRQLSI